MKTQHQPQRYIGATLASMFLAVFSFYVLNESIAMRSALGWAWVAYEIMLFMTLMPYIWTRKNTHLDISRSLFEGLSIVAVLLPMLLFYLDYKDILPLWLHWFLWGLLIGLVIALFFFQSEEKAQPKE